MTMDPETLAALRGSIQTGLSHLPAAHKRTNGEPQMLARTLMSAATLTIPERVHAALLLVLSKLERGELVHGPALDKYGNATDAPNTFNMCSWDCGTAHCILGWACQLSGDSNNIIKRRAWGAAVDSSRGLRALCYPGLGYPGLGPYDEITTDQAAAALRNYLATGNPDWSSVLP